MRRPRAHLCLLTACLLCLAPAHAEDDPASADHARLEAALRAPLEAVRRAARFELIQSPAQSRVWARAWSTDTRADVREQAWLVLEQVGEARDVRPAWDAALRERNSEVAAAAARVVLTLADTHPAPSGAWISADQIVPPERAALFANVLRPRLDGVAQVPRCVLHLGEATLPWLMRLFEDAARTPTLRNTILRALGTMASPASRTALVSLLRQPGIDRAVWLGALRAAGDGPELAPVHAWIATLAEDDAVLARRRRRATWPRGPGWRRQGREALYRFLASRPDDRWRDIVRERLRIVLDVPSWSPSTLTGAARALLALGNPTDDDLTLLVEACAVQNSSRRGMGRFEVLGEIFRALVPHKDRIAVQKALAERRHATATPRTTDAWSKFLDEEVDRNEARAAAVALLVEEPPLAPCLRAGAQILTECGGPSTRLVEAFLDHGDSWLRAWALAWAKRILPHERAAEALRVGADDAHPGVALVAAEQQRTLHGLAQRRRILETAVFHRTASLRARAWRVLDRSLQVPGPAGGTPPTDWTLPTAEASLDERLQAAAWLRARWAADSTLEDHDEALPEGKPEGK